AQAAMLRINPPTSLLLLEDHVKLSRGDWVIQNVANSAVGRHLIVLANQRGIRTINVVRRGDVGRLLRDLGGDVVIEDGPDLAERARQAVGGAPIRLGIDAISGDATRRIMQCVADEGVTVNYGGLSGDDPGIDRPSLGGRGVSLMGSCSAAGSPSAARRLCARSTPISRTSSATSGCRRRSTAPTRSKRSGRPWPMRRGRDATARSWYCRTGSCDGPSYSAAAWQPSTLIRLTLRTAPSGV